MKRIVMAGWLIGALFAPLATAQEMVKSDAQPIRGEAYEKLTEFDRSVYEKRVFKWDEFYSEFERMDTIQPFDMPYRLMLPKGYDPNSDKKYPLVLLLHGSGERGQDNDAQLKHGAYLFAKPDIRNQHPCFVVVPQCPEGMRWADYRVKAKKGRSVAVPAPFAEAPTAPGRMVQMLISELIEELPVKPDIYVMGLSMGGFGTFDYLVRRGNVAAAVPICGGCHSAWVDNLSAPMWIFHGKEDDLVPVKLSQKVYKKRHPTAQWRYTEYQNVGHDAWANAFEEPELLEWLFSH